MAKILIYNGTTPEWIEVNAANVDASGEAPLLKFDAVENFVEEFLADTEAGAANRQQMADMMAANETFVNDVAITEQLAINVAADTQLATNVVAVEGFIGDVASDLVANHLEQIKGEPGESFQIDDSGLLTVEIAAGIMNESGASSTDFYLYLVTVDNRNLSDLEEGLEGIDAANQNTLDDLSRHVIMWDGQSWHDYGQFTALQGPTGAQGAQGVQGEQGLIGPVGPGVLENLNYNQTDANGSVNNITTINATIASVQITTTGGPIQIIATGDSNPVSLGAWARLQLFRDETPIGKILHVESSAINENIPYALNYIDNPNEGTYTYSIRTVDNIAGEHNFGEVDGNHITVVELKGVKGNDGDNLSILDFTYLEPIEGMPSLENESNKITTNSNTLQNVTSLEINNSDLNNVNVLLQDISQNKKYQISVQDQNNNYGVYITKDISSQSITLDNYSYRGFKVAINRIWGDDPNINQLIIYSQNDNAILLYSVDANNTDEDDFTVTNLTANSSIVAAVNVYGSDNSNPIADLQLIRFFNAFVDNVIYTGDSLNNIETIKSNFYNNFNNLTNVLPELYQNFEFSYGENYIGDGGDDQYDGGNYINTNLQSDIFYGNADGNGQGEIITGQDAASAFGEGSSYVTLYQDSIFAMIATNANITSLAYTGETGSDGSGYKEFLTGNLFYAIRFENLQHVKSSGSLTDGELIKFSHKLIGNSENISTWKNPQSQNNWIIENYNDGKFVTLSSKNLIEGTAPTITTFEALNDVNIIRAVWSQELYDFINGLPNYSLAEFSLDTGNTWIEFQGSWGNNPGAGFMEFSLNQNITYLQGVNVLFRYFTGGTPVIWWDKQNTPSGSNGDVRGAIINYHALTDDGTIIGTIHISRDTGDEEVIHTESKSGGNNLQYHDLWYCTQEGVLKYRYNQATHTEKNLRIHWTSTVFNGQDFWD